MGHAMPKQVNKLTADKVRQLKERGYYSDGDGLYLRVGPTGAKSWVFRYRGSLKAGKNKGKLGQCEMGLGPALRRDPETGFEAVTLVDARIEAAKHTNALLALRYGKPEGYDPIDQRREMRRGGQYVPHFPQVRR